MATNAMLCNIDWLQWSPVLETGNTINDAVEDARLIRCNGARS